MIITMKTSNVGGINRKEKSVAPKTKSSWSAIGSIFPGFNPILLLKKDFTRSPVRAPREVMNPKSIGYPKNRFSAMPTSEPIINPEKKPLKVLFSPKIRRPSL